MENNLKAIRLAKGMTQQQLADKIQTAYNYINPMETRTSGDVYASTLLKLALALKVAFPFDIFNWMDEMPAELKEEAGDLANLYESKNYIATYLRAFEWQTFKNAKGYVANEKYEVIPTFKTVSLKAFAIILDDDYDAILPKGASLFVDTTDKPLRVNDLVIFYYNDTPEIARVYNVDENFIFFQCLTEKINPVSVAIAATQDYVLGKIIFIEIEL